MTRLNAIAESGYFPTPPHLLPAIAAQIAPSPYTGGTLLDAFAGEGHAAAFLGDAWRLSTVGVELHEGRAKAARKRLARLICGDAFAVIGTHAQFDACLQNPPYQYDPADRRWQRLEYKASLAVTPYLRPGGLLVAILPDYRITGLPKFAQFFTTHYCVERVLRFPDPDYAVYRQVVIYARKLAEPRANAAEAERLTALLVSGPLVLSETCEAALPLPARPHGKRAYFRGHELDREAMLQEVADFAWSGAKDFPALITPREPERLGRPLMPFKRLHLGQLLAAQVLNNTVLQQACPEQGRRAGVTHVVCGRTRKYLVETDLDEGGDEDGVSVQQAFATESRAFDLDTGAWLTFDQTNVAGLREYIQTWREPLVQAVLAKFPPRYNFDFRERFDAWLVRYLDEQAAARATPIAGRQKRGLFEGQKHAVAAILTALEEQDYVLFGAKQGFGKSMIIGAVIGALTRQWALQTGHRFTAPGWRPSFVITEPTLLDQMANEIHNADPLLRPKIVRNIRDVDRFLDEARTAPWPMVLVASRTSIKDGHGWKPAVVPRRRGYFADEKGHRRLIGETLFACPDCGAFQREAQKEVPPEMWPLVREAAYFDEERRACSACGAPLWQDWRQVCGKPERTASRASAPLTRLPVAEYLARLAKHGRAISAPGGLRRERLKFLVGGIDEVHKYKGHDTNAGYAMAALFPAAEKIVGLTGTVYGGYASTLFHLEYRASPKFRAAWPYRGVRDFVNRYGLLEWIERRKKRRDGDDDDTLGYSDLSGYRRRRERVRELPAVSPELTAHMLDHTLFLGLQDLGLAMVERVDRPVIVRPEEDFLQAYRAFVAEARAAMKEAREQKLYLAGAFLQAMLSFCAAPWRETRLCDKHGRVWAWAPDLEIVCRHCGRTMLKERHCRRCHAESLPKECAGGCGVKQRRIFAKEQALLDRLLESRSQGRPSLVLACQTDTLDIVSPRWTAPDGLCASVGLRAVNGDAWKPAERARRLEEAVFAGADAVFINPRRIELGMNLVQYPDLRHFQLDYSLYTLDQVSARSHRPTQTRPVAVEYLCTAGTYEHAALANVAGKMLAALTLQGDDADSALLQAAGVARGDLLSQIMADVAAVDLPDLRDLFAEYNRAAADLFRPSDFLGGGPLCGDAETRGGNSTDVAGNSTDVASNVSTIAPAPVPTEHELEAALVNVSTEPARQMGLF